MQDDRRADMLFRALAGEAPTPSESDDEELRALVNLGARLDAMGPALATLAGAEQAFNPAFGQKLHRALIAAHPATAENPATSNQETAAQRTVRWMSRRFIALIALIVVLAVIAATVIVQDGRQTSLVGTAVLSPTRVTPRASAKSFAALAPRATPAAGRPAGSPTLPGPAPLSLGSGPPHAGASPTPIPADGFSAASGAAPMHMDTLVPQAADGAGAFRYRLPSGLPSEPVSAPVYRVLQVRTTQEQAGAIAATFSGIRPITGTAGLSFTGDGALLLIIPASGVADYTRTPSVQGSAGPTTPLPKTEVESIARQWLIVHRLLPKKVGPLTVSVTRQGAISSVRFIPTLQLPPLAGAQTPAATVEVAGTGSVVAAHVAWAKLQVVGTATILSPAVAAAGAGAPKAGRTGSTPITVPEIGVTQVTLVYELETRNNILTLRPVYQLTGTLEGKAVSEIVPASWNGT